MLMLIADCTRKSSSGMAGVAKSAGQWLEARSITYSGAARLVRILRTISLPSVPRVTGRLTRDPKARF